jgi:hypothetical protein
MPKAALDFCRRRFLYLQLFSNGDWLVLTVFGTRLIFTLSPPPVTTTRRDAKDEPATVRHPATPSNDDL